MDRLAVLLRHFTLKTDVFHTGSFCGQQIYDGPRGHLHLLRSGAVAVSSERHPTLHLREPGLLLYPRPVRHLFMTTEDDGADLICATVDLDSAAGSPIAYALPDVLHVPFAGMPAMLATLELLVAESCSQLCGRQAALDRLCELLLIQLLRHMMNTEAAPAGLLAGLADRRLAKALTAMHEQPAASWSLEELARTAGMSRARFAAHFRATLGCTPGSYLASWRINLACAHFRQGRPAAWVADAVGYAGATALARAFRAHIGTSPAQWLKKEAQQRL